MQLVIDVGLVFVYGFFVVAIFSYITRFWKLYANQDYTNEELQGKAIMLEIKLPREIEKTPLAMELVLVNLIQGGGVGNWYVKSYKGQLPATFSLEVVSLEGVIHFYIRTHKKFKELISSSLYAQYPGVEVVEADDYTALLPRVTHKASKDKRPGFWGNSYKLGEKWVIQKEQKEDKAKGIKAQEAVEAPLDALPMRTYVDLKLDSTLVDEEKKVDPLVSVLEIFSSIGKGEYMAFQIILQDESLRDDKKFPKLYENKTLEKPGLTLKELANSYRDSLRGKKEVKKGDIVYDEFGAPKVKTSYDKESKTTSLEEVKYAKDMTIFEKRELTQTEKNRMELIERKISKPMFACVVRAIYVTDPNAKFNPNQIQSIIWLFKSFGAPGFNVLGPKKFADPYDYPWQKEQDRRPDWRKEEMFEAFVEREGFHPHTGLIDYLGETSDKSGSTTDVIFYPFPSYVRKTFTVIAEALIHPFGHPSPDEVFSMNTEEVATLFHFPGTVAQVPGLPRLDSKKTDAPVNLPV